MGRFLLGVMKMFYIRWSHGEYTKNHRTVWFKRVKFMACESLSQFFKISAICFILPFRESGSTLKSAVLFSGNGWERV